MFTLLIGSIITVVLACLVLALVPVILVCVFKLIGMILPFLLLMGVVATIYIIIKINKLVRGN